MIFDVINPEKIWHQYLVHVPILPVYCTYFTLWNTKSNFSTVLFIHTSDYLRYLRRKQTVTPLLTTPEKCTALAAPNDWSQVKWDTNSCSLHFVSSKQNGKL